MKGITVIAAVAAALAVSAPSALAATSPNPWKTVSTAPNPWKVIGAPTSSQTRGAKGRALPSQAKGWGGKAWAFRPAADWSSRAS